MSNFEKRLTIIIAILLVIVLILLFIITREKKSNFNVVFLDVGQGDATLIDFGRGQQMLVDCGETRKVLDGLGKWMPFYDKTIEYLVVTHSDADHYLGCVDVLGAYNVENVWHNGRDNAGDPQWDVWKEKLANEKTNELIIDREERYEMGETIIDVLYPDHSVIHDATVPGVEKSTSDNNTSIVMRVQSCGSSPYQGGARGGSGDGRTSSSPSLERRGVSILLTGDAEQEAEQYLIQKYAGRLKSDILKTGHHGSNSSSSEEFLEAVSPSIATISCGKDNSFGHPHRRTLKRLERVGAEIRRTDLEGDIALLP